MDDPFVEIDMLLRRANKIYFGWTSASLATIGVCFYASRFSKWKKVFFTIGTTLPVAGCLSWVHILKTFSEYELAYLLAGLDFKYLEIKEERKNNKK